MEFKRIEKKLNEIISDEEKFKTHYNPIVGFLYYLGLNSHKTGKNLINGLTGFFGHLLGIMKNCDHKDRKLALLLIDLYSAQNDKALLELGLLDLVTDWLRKSTKVNEV